MIRAGFIKRPASIVLHAFIIVIGVLFVTADVAYAEDLIVDVSAVGQQQGYENSESSAGSSELFTDESVLISESIANQKQMKRENLMTGLFVSVHRIGKVDEHSQIINLAEDVGLFSSPVNYIKKTNSSESISVSPLTVVAIFVVFGAVGYLIARGLLRREKKDVDVY
jgi:hypothetical protein